MLKIGQPSQNLVRRGRIGKMLKLKNYALLHNKIWHCIKELDEVDNDASCLLKKCKQMACTGHTTQLASGACSRNSAINSFKILLVFALFPHTDISIFAVFIQCLNKIHVRCCSTQHN